jgi:hypothetical protein
MDMDMRLAAAACCGLLLTACAPVKPSRPDLPPLQLADCAALYPHQDRVPDLSPAEATPPPAQLADLGAAHLALARFQGCQQDDAVLQNQHLAALARQLQYDQAQLRDDTAAWQKRDDSAKAVRDQYQAECAQPDLPDAQYQSCVQRSRDLNTEIAALNAANAGLSQRNDALNARIQDYDRQAAAAAGAVPDAYSAYTAALKSEADWLDRARYLVNSTEYRSAAAAAGCPDVMTSPKTVDAMHVLSTSLIACLKHLTGAP